MPKRRVTLILAALPLLVAVAACSSAGSGASTPTGGGASAAPSSGGKGPGYDYGSGSGASPSAAPSAAVDGTDLAVGTGSGAAGTYLTGPNGMTLYVLTKDSDETSVCAGDCAAAWPPLIADAGQAVSAGAGISGAFSTFARDDGAMQVAYDGKPLYYFAADKAAGDTNGQGVNDVWFIAEP